MKTKHPIEILDLRHQPAHISPKKIQLLQEYGADPENARFFKKIISWRETKFMSDGNKLIEVKVIWTKFLNFKKFIEK